MKWIKLGFLLAALGEGGLAVLSIGGPEELLFDVPLLTVRLTITISALICLALCELMEMHHEG